MKIPTFLSRMNMTDLARQPEIQAIGRRIAAEQLEHRKALVAELAGASPPAADVACADAARAVARAEADVIAATAALEAAKARRLHASNALSTKGNQIHTRRRALEMELRETADPRLESFISALDDLFVEIRPLVTTEFEPAPAGPTPKQQADVVRRQLEAATAQEQSLFRINGWLSGSAERAERGKIATNAKLVANALDLIRAIRPEVEAAQLEAIDAAEVSRRLADWREDLRAASAQVRQALPSIDEEDFSPAAA